MKRKQNTYTVECRKTPIINLTTRDLIEGNYPVKRQIESERNVPKKFMVYEPTNEYK